MVNITKIATQAVLGAFTVLFLKEAAEKGIGRAFGETGAGLGIGGSGVGTAVRSIGSGIGQAGKDIGSGFSGLISPVGTVLDLIFAPSAGKSVQPAQEQTLLEAKELRSAQSADFFANPFRVDKVEKPFELFPFSGGAFTQEAIRKRINDQQRAFAEGRGTFGGFANAESQEAALQAAIAEQVALRPEFFK